jgi:hypothetical protein
MRAFPQIVHEFRSVSTIFIHRSALRSQSAPGLSIIPLYKQRTQSAVRTGLHLILHALICTRPFRVFYLIQQRRGTR